jgi:hypothetical protein
LHPKNEEGKRVTNERGIHINSIMHLFFTTAGCADILYDVRCKDDRPVLSVTRRRKRPVFSRLEGCTHPGWFDWSNLIMELENETEMLRELLDEGKDTEPWKQYFFWKLEDVDSDEDYYDNYISVSSMSRPWWSGH